MKSQKLLSSIPYSWDNQYNDFNLLVKNEKKLRKKYRRSSDQFYSEMSNLVFILKGNKQFYNLENKVRNFEIILNNSYTNKPLILNEIKDLSKVLSSVDDNGKMKSYLNKIKRKVRKKTPNLKSILNDYNNLIKVYDKKFLWLSNADMKLTDKLEKLLTNTSHTLGARSQKKIPRETALFLAACNSVHKDISLNF